MIFLFADWVPHVVHSHTRNTTINYEAYFILGPYSLSLSSRWFRSTGFLLFGCFGRRRFIGGDIDRLSIVQITTNLFTDGQQTFDGMFQLRRRMQVADRQANRIGRIGRASFRIVVFFRLNVQMVQIVFGSNNKYTMVHHQRMHDLLQCCSFHVFTLVLSFLDRVTNTVHKGTFQFDDANGGTSVGLYF